MERVLVLFDFDGTLSQKDTFFQFIFYTKGKSAVYFTLLKNSFNILLFLLGLVSAEELKLRLFSALFKDCTRAELRNKGKQFAEHIQSTNSYRKEILDKLTHYKINGATIYVVSASLDVWIHPICENLGVKAICTEVALEEDRFKEKFKTKNCNGDEKANRILSELNLKEFSKVIAYGNSKGDAAMLQLANEAYMV